MRKVRASCRVQDDTLVHPLFTAIFLAPLAALALPYRIICAVCAILFRAVRGVVRLQCWFCHTWAEVPRRLRDGWQCRECTQYNGFDKDGGYNQPVAAQYTDALNPRVTPRRSPGDAPRPAPSVLCPACQLRQEAIVRAMAAFEPANEADYDSEARAHLARVERQHPLCGPCQNAASLVIRQRQAWASNWAFAARRRALSATPPAPRPLLYRRAAAVLILARLLLAVLAAAVCAVLVARRAGLFVDQGGPAATAARLVAGHVHAMCLAGAYGNAALALALGKRLVRRADLLNLAAAAVLCCLLAAARLMCRAYPGPACLAHRHATAMDLACIAAAVWMVVTQTSVLLLGDKFDVWRDRHLGGHGAPPATLPAATATPPARQLPVYAATTPDEIATLMAKVVDLGPRGPAIYGLAQQQPAKGPHPQPRAGGRWCLGSRGLLAASLVLNMVAMAAAATVFLPDLFQLGSGAAPPSRHLPGPG